MQKCGEAVRLLLSSLIFGGKPEGIVGNSHWWKMVLQLLVSSALLLLTVVAAIYYHYQINTEHFPML